MNNRLFSGIYPTGIVYADREVEVDGDYKRLAFLPYSTLKLEVEADCPPPLYGQIVANVARMNLKPGQQFATALNASSVITLGQ